MSHPTHRCHMCKVLLRSNAEGIDWERVDGKRLCIAHGLKSTDTCTTFYKKNANSVCFDSAPVIVSTKKRKRDFDAVIPRHPHVYVSNDFALLSRLIKIKVNAHYVDSTTEQHS